MALEMMANKYIPKENAFMRRYHAQFIYLIIVFICLAITVGGFILYQLLTRPLPTFIAVQANGKQLSLTSYTDPNQLPSTILTWASKGAVLAYTFDFVNYNKDIELARPFFTEGGWNDYKQSVKGVIGSVVRQQLIVNGMVSGTPVIVNQGPLPGFDYAWRVQIPFLVTYQSANTTFKKNFFVVLTIVKVSTVINPQGIGIDQFVMVSA